MTLPNGIVVNYGYDQASELTGLTYSLAGNVLGNLTYAYDADGRRTQMGGSWARTGMPNPTTSTAVYNADNELTNWNGATLTYDLNGNLLSDGANTYNWNARNQLDSTSGTTAASFQYGPFGRRLGKTINGSTTNFLYDGVNPVQELVGGSPSANLLTGLGVDEYFTRTDLTGTSNFLSDALGSTVALADPTGTVQTQYTYDPFGGTTTQGVANANSFQYTGRENDSDGLFYYRARYYDPMFSRFVSQDPVGIDGGSTNPYLYTLGGPSDFIDPRGTDPIVGATVGAIAGAIYGAYGAALQCGGTRGVVAGAIAGAFVGAGAGFVDPTLGVGTLAVVGGLSSAAGDLASQWLATGGKRPVNWGSTLGAGIGGAIGGAGAGALGTIGEAVGWPEWLTGSLGSSVCGNLGARTANFGGQMWGSNCGCQ